MNKFVIALMISVATTGSIHAQVSAPPPDLIRVGTVAPEVASLGKFGNIPVSPCTGIPGISIPVYNISVGKITLPISLDYHAAGIRVDETASCVGLGWSLNANGMIYRTMVGRPDEESGTGYIASPDAHSVVMSKGTYATYLFKIHKGLADAEPDIFQYNFNGQSGKFIFKHDGSVMEIPASNNKIVYSGGNFTITNDNGDVYIFDEKQLSQSSEVTTPIYTSHWRLTKIVAANTTDTIYFSYESGCSSTGVS
ncbi:hypothetical protein [Chitinophaga japonensis]|uniref:Uncharacterized protein n=1 Tax=Chitinophaga japonensis TaxID=104662 RepID=A0A562SZU3_CHIJA|nr:hypothetical protein [Chitinophaga japonensis]TWI86762.1 hypothetical protein LX66_4026 [Chitinophaga japonensis]